MKKILFMVTGFCLAYTVSTFAQSSDQFLDSFYEPDLIIRHKNEIGLTYQQEIDLKTIYERNNAVFIEKKEGWLQAMADFQRAVSLPKVDYQQIDEKFSKVLAIESDIKKIKLVSLAEIKNSLSKTQQSKLDAIKKQNPNYSKAFELPLGPKSSGATITIKDNSLSDENDQRKATYFIKSDSKSESLKTDYDFMAKMNPEDIESITVLKGSSAIDKYGELGNHGVVEITLKKGTKAKYFKE